MRVLIVGLAPAFARAIEAALRALPEVAAVVVHAGDLSHERACHELLHGAAHAHGIDVVVCGALPPVAVRHLLHACGTARAIRRVVYVGTASVYAVRASQPTLLDEEAPLELDPGAPDWLRDQVEADLTACARIGVARYELVVLRLAEILGPQAGGQLWDYLRSRVCLRPLGFDPMINVLGVEDAADAVACAVVSHGRGVYNIPGADTLPLSRLIARHHRLGLPVPGPLLAPLYRLRTWAVGFEFRYDVNLRRFHFGGVLDGHLAADELGYAPRCAVPASRPAPVARPARSDGQNPV